jgi:hypothetical protein
MHLARGRAELTRRPQAPSRRATLARPVYAGTQAPGCDSVSFLLADAAAPIVGVVVHEGEVVADADQGPAVTGDRDDGARAEDGVHGAALEAEFGEVASCKQCRGVVETLGGGWTGQAMPHSSARR